MLMWLRNVCEPFRSKLRIELHKKCYLEINEYDTACISGIKVILINRDQYNKIEITEIISKNKNSRNPIFCCSCGTKILIIPDLPEMDRAIKNHVIEHKKITGSNLTEELLTQEILRFIIKSINET